MNMLIVGLLVFLGVHSVRILAPGWRERCITRFGAARWKLAYTLVSLLGFALIVQGFALARRAPEVLWATPAWAPHLAGLLMLLSMTLLVGYGLKRSRLSIKVSHPMLWGVVVWSGAHLIANNTRAELLLFGSFLLWALLALGSCYARDRDTGQSGPRPVAAQTLANLVLGLLLWAAVAFWLHQWLIGVAPFGVH